MLGKSAPESPSVLSGLRTPESAAAQAASLSGFVSAALYLEALAGGMKNKLFSVHIQDPLPSPHPLNVCSPGGSASPCSFYLLETEVLPVGSLPTAATSSSHQCQENTALFHTVLVYLS